MHSGFGRVAVPVPQPLTSTACIRNHFAALKLAMAQEFELELEAPPQDAVARPIGQQEEHSFLAPDDPIHADAVLELEPPPGSDRLHDSGLTSGTAVKFGCSSAPREFVDGITSQAHYRHALPCRATRFL